MRGKDFSSTDELSAHIRGLFGSEANVILMYAFNATGKTRLASTFIDEADNSAITSITYGAFFEDMFSWSPEAHEIRFEPNYSWILRTIRDEGLDAQIIEKFRDYTQSKVEPVIDFTSGWVNFRVASGDEQNLDSIRISKGEESIFVWSIFYTFLELAVQTLQEDQAERSTNIFNDLKYVIIDDPVSSIDDTRIVHIGIEVARIAKAFEKMNIKVLVTTHHALFYNVIANSKLNKRGTFLKFNLSKTATGLCLSNQDDSPFAYHLFAKRLIQEAIDTDSLERYHFNLFRALLEKTANFLGYQGWSECLNTKDKEKVTRILHLNSHGKLSEMEPRTISQVDKESFTRAFDQFITDYRWGKS